MLITSTPSRVSGTNLKIQLCWIWFFYGFKRALSILTQLRGKDQIQRNKQAPQPVSSDWYASDAFTNEAIKQIDQALKQNKPFFSYAL